MDEVNVAVIAPILGRDLSFASDVDPRVRVFDANFASPGRRAGSDGPAAPGTASLAAILAQAEVLLVGFPVPEGLAARSPRLVWAHHTQAGVSNLAGATCGPRKSRSRPVAVGWRDAIAEYAIAAVALRPRPGRGSAPEGTRVASPGRATGCSPSAERRWASSGWAASAGRWRGCRVRPACG